MEEKQRLTIEELESVAGGWGMSDLTPSERAEYDRLMEEYKKAARLALKDPSYESQADAAYDELYKYHNYLNKIYKYKEEHGML